jgi:hypothetical protein
MTNNDDVPEKSIPEKYQLNPQDLMDPSKEVFHVEVSVYDDVRESNQETLDKIRACRQEDKVPFNEIYYDMVVEGITTISLIDRQDIIERLAAALTCIVELEEE